MNDPNYVDKTITSLPAAPSRAADDAHYLLVLEGRSRGERFELSGAHTVGRDVGVSIRLDDPSVSRVHCRVELRGEAVFVIDTGSTNGSFVEGYRVQGALELEVGAVLQVGDQLLRHELRSRAEVARELEFAQDLLKARAYVSALIPGPLNVGALNIDWAYQPCAALGGDLLGYHWLDRTRLALYVLDVCGHGVGPAMHSASVLNVLRNQTLPRTDFGAPSQVLEQLGRSFPMESHGGMYLTAWYGVLDVTTRKLRYASAGHPPALLLGAGPLQRLHTKNPPLGTVEERAYREAELQLSAPARLLVFSDGVFEFERRSQEPASFEAFEQFVERERFESAATLQRKLQETAKTGAFDDDFTLLSVALRAGV
jgi:serine phosphatase RsbU (regulator of sigma subunit)